MKFMIKLFMVTVIGLVILRACHHDRDPYETIKLQQEKMPQNFNSLTIKDTTTWI